MWNNSGQTLNQLVSFSSLGPTADGRMKPDITAPRFYVNIVVQQFHK